jgi:rod shape-determining protein MreD
VNRGLLYYLMAPLLLLLCLLQSTAASRFAVFGVKPDLVLLLIIVGALLYGPRAALVWAFIGGVGMDIFSGGPMGASSLALMAAALVASLGHRPLSRFNWVVPVGAALLGTLTYAVTYLGLLAVLDNGGWFARSVPFVDTVRAVVLPAAIYNTVLMLLLLPWLNRMPESQEL